MKLTQKALTTISNDKTTVLKLALALGFTEVWINRLVGANKENGPLTTAKAILVIKEETDLQDDEILEDEIKEAV